MIELKNIYSGYGKKEVLHNINFTPETGKITGIIGPNGCGKSTLLKTIVGLADVMGGDILVGGKNVKEISSLAVAREVAYLPQSKTTPDMTVSQIVLHGRFPHLDYPRRYKKEDFRIAYSAMEKMEITDIKDKNLTELSGGQKQKTYIAMALCQSSPVILMDEPTTYLDIAHQIKLCDIIKDLADMGKTVVTVLHDLPLAMRICDNICVMNAGETLFSGTPDEVLESGIIEQVFEIKMKKLDGEYILKRL